MENNSMQHWGIKGMRWGVRRYQNSDGTLTPAGKKRYEKEMEELKSEERTLKNKARTQAKMDKLEAKRKSVEDLRKADQNAKDRSETQKSDKKKKTPMTDEELREKIARLELEKRYRELSAQSLEATKKKPSKFKDVAKDCIEKASKNIGAQLVTYMLGTATNAAFKNVFDEDVVNPKKGQKDK